MTMANLRIISALAALATVGLTFAISACPPSAHAQTQGMDRRDDRRDTRQDSRDVKQACKAGDENTRAECRQDKRDVKQEGRQN
jgi:Ni/Co efflux regulator RcnB